MAVVGTFHRIAVAASVESDFGVVPADRDCWPSVAVAGGNSSWVFEVNEAAAGWRVSYELDIPSHRKDWRGTAGLVEPVVAVGSGWHRIVRVPIYSEPGQTMKEE